MNRSDDLAAGHSTGRRLRSMKELASPMNDEDAAAGSASALHPGADEPDDGFGLGLESAQPWHSWPPAQAARDLRWAWERWIEWRRRVVLALLAGTLMSVLACGALPHLST